MIVHCECGMSPTVHSLLVLMNKEKNMAVHLLLVAAGTETTLCLPVVIIFVQHSSGHRLYLASILQLNLSYCSNFNQKKKYNGYMA
jgi:hypothetical protein